MGWPKSKEGRWGGGKNRVDKIFRERGVWPGMNLWVLVFDEFFFLLFFFLQNRTSSELVSLLICSMLIYILGTLIFKTVYLNYFWRVSFLINIRYYINMQHYHRARFCRINCQTTLRKQNSVYISKITFGNGPEGHVLVVLLNSSLLKNKHM